MIDKITNFFSSPNVWVSIIIVVLGIVAWIVFRRFLKLIMKKSNVHEKRQANVRFIAAITKYLLGVFIAIVVLQINGINVTSLITGLGIASVIIGFAVQDLLKDMIMGGNIIWNGFYKIGDVVRYGDVEGKVISLSARVTKVQDINNGGIVTISNRNISEIEVMSDWLDINIPTSYSEDCDYIRGICEKICTEIKTLEKTTDCEFLGTDEFADSFISYRLRIYCAPEYRNAVRRNALGIIQDVFKESGLTIPYPQLDVHVK